MSKLSPAMLSHVIEGLMQKVTLAFAGVFPIYQITGLSMGDLRRLNDNEFAVFVSGFLLGILFFIVSYAIANTVARLLLMCFTCDNDEAIEKTTIIEGVRKKNE